MGADEFVVCSGASRLVVDLVKVWRGRRIAKQVGGVLL